MDDEYAWIDEMNGGARMLAVVALAFGVGALVGLFLALWGMVG